MSHNRWVIVSEESFDQGPLTTLPKEQPETKPTELIEEAQDPPASPSNSLEAPEEVIEPEGVSELLQESKPREFGDIVGGTVAASLQELPPSFRQGGVHLLAELEKYPEFAISDDGTVKIGGKTLVGYRLAKFLRTTCVPFNKEALPPAVYSFLRDKGIKKLRNHLIKIRPKWIKRYSWKPSTTETRQGLLGVQKRSTNKPISRATLPYH